MHHPVPRLVHLPGDQRWAQEACNARHRLYPVTIIYSAYCLGLLAYGLRGDHRVAMVGWFLAGVAAWTLIEYLVHRHILHGRFPDGPGLMRHFLHKRFDHLHWEHHARPWDAQHINGRTRDTLPFALVFIGLAALFPLHTAPVFVAGIIQSYVVEEWVHHSVHFYHFRNRYFRYIKRHHLFHHSPRGAEVGYGLTSGFWDIVWRTRIPARTRRALHHRAARRLSQRTPAPAPQVTTLPA